MIKITLPIIPTAQMRARHANRGGFPVTYKAKKQVESEQGIMQLLEKYRPEKPLEGAIRITICAYLPIPQSKPQWWKDAADKGYIFHIVKPDKDNLEKNILDCMTKLSFWHDDCQIITGLTKKEYSANPRWYIEVDNIYQPKTKKDVGL